jgi:hypothetical protein
MTDNIVLLGFAAAGVPGFSVTRAVVSLIGFVVGALLGGRLGVAMAGVARRRWLLSVAVVEAGLCFVAVWAAIGRVFQEFPYCRLSHRVTASNRYKLATLAKLAPPPSSLLHHRARIEVEIVFVVKPRTLEMVQGDAGQA